MPTVRLWIETIHHVAFRLGGWAYVRDIEGAVSGYAGGERNLTAARLDLGALAAALDGLPAGAAVSIRTANPALLAIGRALAAPPAEPPTEDLDLWAQLLRASNGKALSVVAAPAGSKTPQAFLAAWAEVGRDKAKVAGRFSAAIPKSNLAKLALG
jgi:hypothetical protein